MRMTARLNEATLLEAGLVAAGFAVAGAALVLGGGRVAESIVRARHHRTPPPERGKVAAERHRHVTAVAAR